jgi:hypothetical protein
MVGHEAIRENIDLVFLGVVLQLPQIGETIIIAKEYVLAAITALGNMMRHAGADGSGESGHTANLPRGTYGDKG